MSSKFPVYFMIVCYYTWGRRPFTVKDKERHCDVITKKKKTPVFSWLWTLKNNWVFSACGEGVHVCVWEREEERARKERIKGRRETEGEERIPFIRVYLSYIVNISFEGRQPMTHSVKSSKLIVVDFESWDYSFVIVGISFRSASCISAPTF